MKEKNFDNFDEFSNNYRDLHNTNIKISGTNSDFFSEYKIKILKKWENKDFYRIMDLGCGDGNSEKFFNLHFPISEISGIDVSSDSIEKARSRNLVNCYFTTYSGYELPYNDNYFDIAFVSTVLHHIDENLQPKLLEEIFRVLKPAGRLFIFEHNPNNILTNYLVSRCEFDRDAVLIPSNLMKNRIQGAGFIDIAKRFVFFVPRYPVIKYLSFIEYFLTWLPFGGQYYIRAIK